MKTLSRTLSLIISFQLMWGCNQVSTSSGTIKTRAPGSTDTISISGSIASTIHNLSNLIMPNAMAAIGTLYLYDDSDLSAPPVLLDQWEISGDTYSINAKKSVTQGKILKLSFESSEDSGKNREIFIDASEAVNSKIEAPINHQEYFKSKVLETQLQSEFEGGSFTNMKEVKARFSAMKRESFDSELALLGDNGEMLDMINAGDSDSILSMAKLIYNHRLAKLKGDADSINSIKSTLFGYGQKIGVIKDDQSLLSCSANQGTFIFNNQYFDVFVLSDDADFGSVKLYGQVKNTEDAQKMINDLVNSLAKMSDKLKRDISARINFVAYDAKTEEMNVKSCLLSGREMSAEELAAIKDSSSGVMFDESFLKSVPFDQFSNMAEGEKYLNEMLNRTRDALKNLLANGVDDKVRNALMENQLPLIKALFDSRIAELRDFFASPKVSTLEMEQLSTGDVLDFDSAYGRLRDMYNKALFTLTTKIADSGIDPDQAIKIFEEQTLVANAVFERRVSDFVENFQPFKQPDYRLDLSPLQGLSFEGVDNPYALATNTLEESAKRFYGDLLQQGVDKELANIALQEQRNYGYIFIKLRIDEYTYHSKMLEMIGSFMAKYEVKRQQTLLLKSQF